LAIDKKGTGKFWQSPNGELASFGKFWQIWQVLASFGKLNIKYLELIENFNKNISNIKNKNQ
jgi:hypothetical protein